MSFLQNQDAFVLLAFLRAHNGPWSHFMCTNSLAERFGWTRQRMGSARTRLIALEYIKPVAKPDADTRLCSDGPIKQKGGEDRTPILNLHPLLLPPALTALREQASAIQRSPPRVNEIVIWPRAISSDPEDCCEPLPGQTYAIVTIWQQQSKAQMESFGSTSAREE